jgi:hypothetical protein
MLAVLVGQAALLIEAAWIDRQVAAIALKVQAATFPDNRR